MFIFFLMSTGIYLMLADIGISNTKLSSQSQQDLINLEIYNENASAINPFGSEQEFNYSLTDYSNTDEFSQSNIETKGAVVSIMDIFGENKLSAMAAPITFMGNMLPFDDGAFSWTYGQILTFISIMMFIAFLAAWKAGYF